MNPVHIHLVLNHIPALGICLAVALLLLGYIQKSEDIKRVSLYLLVLFALFTVPVYLSGEAAEDLIEDLPGISESRLDAHEDAGELIIWAVGALGLMALAACVVFNRQKRLPLWLSLPLIALALAVEAGIIWTAYLGGQIRHPELVEDLKTLQEAVPRQNKHPEGEKGH